MCFIHLPLPSGQSWVRARTKMRVLITGNLGYVGPAVVRRLRATMPNAYLHGFDSAFFAHCLTDVEALPERLLNNQSFGDIRSISPDALEGFDAVVHLAAVSNDPMGSRFSDVTQAINQDASISLAELASKSGVKNFVFASSCSVYGVADGGPRREEDPLNPITAYAASKIGTEQGLGRVEGGMTITCLRFATACGMSSRLRLDLVLNDFVAAALTSGRISVLSDGTPWRPLIDTEDMARAIEWAATRSVANGGRFLVVNAGTDSANYQVRDLAAAVAEALPGTEVSIATDAPADSRSYQVNFAKYAQLAPQHQPIMALDDSIRNLIKGLRELQFGDENFRTSSMIRLRVLQDHLEKQRLTEDLFWSRFSGKAADA